MKNILLALMILLSTVLLSLSVAPIKNDSREQVFEIPKGTWSERMKGKDINILPSTIRLVLGVKDILVLRNLDDVPQMFGPTLIMPDQSFKLPFESVAEYQFICTAHVSGQMTIIVEEEPSLGLARLKWRLRNIFSSI